MIMALSVKNKEGFVDGTISAPPSTDPKYSAWRRCNMVVSAWIVSSIPKEISISVIYMDTARQIWVDLKERFSQSNDPRIYQIQKTLSSLSQNHGSVISYYTRLKGLWEELANF